MFKFVLITFIFSSNFLNFSFFKSVKADSHKSLLLEGIEKIKRDDFKGGLIDINKFLKQDPTSWEAYYHRARSKVKLGDFKGASSDYSRSIELNPNPIGESFFGRGFTKDYLGDHEGAISDFTKSIDLNPGSFRSFYLRAMNKDKLGQYLEAIKDLDIAIEMSPFESIFYQYRGFIKEKNGDLDGAVSDYKSVFNFGNEDEIFFSIQSLIDVYSSFGEYQEIPELLVKGKQLLNKISLKEGDIYLLFKEALYNSFIGNINKAERLLEECLANIAKEERKYSLYYSSCKNLLIGSYIKQKEFKKAKKLIDYWSGEGQFNLAFIAFMENKLPKAEKILKRAYKLQFKDSKNKNPDPFLSSMLGSILWFQGKNKESKIYHEETLNTYKSIYGDENPILIQPLINLAMVHFNDGEYEKTDPLLRQSLDLQFKFINQQISFLPLSKREAFIKNLGISYKAIFSASTIHPKGKYLALYARLNRHGLLEEIERKQTQMSTFKGSQKILIDKISNITNQISSVTSKDNDLLKILKIEKEDLESKLYKSLPKLE